MPQESKHYAIFLNKRFWILNKNSCSAVNFMGIMSDITDSRIFWFWEIENNMEV